MATDPKLEQRLSALAVGNERRLKKAAMKRMWRSGPSQADVCREVADLLEDGPGDLGSFKVVELLTTIPGIGKTKANSLARAADWVELTHKVEHLTARRRELLARVLRDRADEVEARVQSAA